jgi:hypothetical protein
MRPSDERMLAQAAHVTPDAPHVGCAHAWLLSARVVPGEVDTLGFDLRRPGDRRSCQHIHLLMAFSGPLIIIAGLALSRGWCGLTEALASGYRRWGMPVPVPMLRFMGRALIGMDVIWTLVGVLASA